MSCYLVTGAAGFIGTRVSRLLCEQGHRVIGVDNLNDAYDLRLKEWRLGELRRCPGFVFERLDICDRGALGELFRRYQASAGQRLEAVLNLAARAGVRPSVVDPWIYFATNVTGALNLLECCREHGVPKFVQASTSSVYGAGAPRPFREDGRTDGPLSPYAASKKAAEVLGYTYHYLHAIDVTVLRYFTVYGPGGRPDMSIFRFVQWLHEGRPLRVFGDGSQERDFTYVDDIAEGTVRALRPLGYEVINLGSDHPVALREVIRLIEELAGTKARIEFAAAHPADVPATWADVDRARRLLGWEPRWSIADGLAEAVRWYRAHRDWAAGVLTGDA